MYKKPLIQTLETKTFETVGVKVDTLRLDLIHPHVSGNKWYKLKYHIETAVNTAKKGLLSFGGAYSNHLVAMAYACKEISLPAIGIIRGEEPAVYSPSLQQMKELGMKLIFVSRQDYKEKNARGYEDYHIVPEGGAGELGIKGASEIMKEVRNDYSHILCSVGTGTTMAGIINASTPSQHIIGISALKMAGIENNGLLTYIGAHAAHNNHSLLFDYHFGGYAKRTAGLLAFMNRLYKEENIPTDFVYTGKLFYAAEDLAQKNYFPRGSKLLIIHSGGLQGNRSLAAGDLIF